MKKKVTLKGQKNRDTFSMYACHPCAGTMLIFSVSFQFFQMTSEEVPNSSHPPLYIRVLSSDTIFVMGSHFSFNKHSISYPKTIHPEDELACLPSLVSEPCKAEQPVLILSARRSLPSSSVWFYSVPSRSRLFSCRRTRCRCHSSADTRSPCRAPIAQVR